MTKGLDLEYIKARATDKRNYHHATIIALVAEIETLIRERDAWKRWCEKSDAALTRVEAIKPENATFISRDYKWGYEQALKDVTIAIGWEE